MNAPKMILTCQDVCKTYQEGDLETPVLHNINMHIAAGETVAIIGASGSGKSTLLHLLGGLDSPSSGKICLQNQNLKNLSPKAIGVLRNQNLGFVYQFHHLLGDFTALENVMMPLLIQNMPKKQAEARAQAKLEQVGLGHRLAHRPSELSGGERQRAAIARALVTEPACILADEPTGNLDAKNAAAVWEMLCELNRAQGSALVVVTHDLSLARQMQRQLTLKNGVLTDFVA